jgi:exosortase
LVILRGNSFSVFWVLFSRDSPYSAVQNLGLYLLIAGFTAHASMLWLHFTRMWNAEHYQFFPVALVATGVLAYGRRADILAAATRPNPWLLWMGSGVTIATCLLASLLGLALTGFLSCVAFLSVVIYAGYGRGGLWASMPIFVMLLIIKPVPTFLEQFLTINMQTLASSLGSHILNLMGILHYQQGVVLRLVNASFMAEEACSGIRSLFSSIAAITFLGLMNRYHWARHLVNILQTIMWVIILNAFRIAFVVYVEDKFGPSFSIASGWPHELFGYLIFFSIFGLVLSTDRLIAGVVVPKVLEPPQDVATLPKHWSDYLVWPGGTTGGLVLASIFGLVGLLSIRMLYLVPDYKTGFAAEDLPPAERDYMPEQIAGWEVIGFRHAHRSEEDLQGKDSYLWELRKGDKQVTLSVDGSFNEFHDLLWCYTALGWSCAPDRLYTPIADRADGKVMDDGEFTHLRLNKLTGETGHVIFSGVDKNGTIVVPPPQVGQETAVFFQQALANALRFAVGLDTQEGLRAKTFQGPVSNIQLVYVPNEPVDGTEIDELKKLFLAARDILRQTPRFEPS